MRDSDGVTLRTGALGMLRNPFQEQFQARQASGPDPVQTALSVARQAQTGDQAGLTALLARIRSLPGRGDGLASADPNGNPMAAEIPPPSGPVGAPAAGGVFDVPDAYKDAVAQAAERYGVPQNVLASIFWNESRWNPNAVNPGDQRGSINPETGKPYDSVGIGQWGEQWAKARGFDPRDDKASINETAKVMREYADRYGGNVLLARLAYGWGPGNVDSWIKQGADPERIPDGARVWLPRTALGIADDRAAREAWARVAPYLRLRRAS